MRLETSQNILWLVGATEGDQRYAHQIYAPEYFFSSEHASHAVGIMEIWFWLVAQPDYCIPQNIASLHGESD